MARVDQISPKIDPKRAIPREEHLRNTRYFVGGLAPSTSAESMKDFFSTYGKVVDATVMVDRESGRSKGFGFVTFEDGNSAEQLVGKIGLVMDDKQVCIAFGCGLALFLLMCVLRRLRSKWRNRATSGIKTGMRGRTRGCSMMPRRTGIRR